MKTGSIGYGHTGPCQPGCTCDIAKGLRETSVTFEGRAKAIVYPWSSETSPLEFEAAQAVLIARIAEALRTVEREALERAAMLVAGWHVNKGGYGILSEAIAELNGDSLP